MVDTNILLHAANLRSPEHSRCGQALVSLANGPEPMALCWPVIYEFLRVATHPRVFARPLPFGEAWAYVAALMDSPAGVVLTATRHHREVVEQCVREALRLSGNLVHDFHLAVLAREHGITEIATLDTDFRAFPWLTIRPL